MQRCKALGTPVSGNKADLIRRILNPATSAKPKAAAIAKQPKKLKLPKKAVAVTKSTATSLGIYAPAATDASSSSAAAPCAAAEAFVQQCFASGNEGDDAESLSSVESRPPSRLETCSGSANPETGAHCCELPCRRVCWL